ncbi:MAG: DoxX family protein [Nocardioides sp.]
MNVFLWIVAVVLAVAFAASGTMKLIKPKSELAAQGMGWVEDFSPTQIKLIGALEVLAAVGLVVPPLLDIAPVLAPLAALGLVLVMAGAIVTHARRKETPMIAVNLVLLSLAAVVVWGRFGPEQFTA